MREVVGGLGHRVVRLADPQVLVALAGLLVGVVGDPRGVGEEVVGGDGGRDGGPLQLEIADDRGVQAERSPFHQLQGRDRGEQLGDRRGVEAGLQRTGRLPGPVGVPVGRGEQLLVASGHCHGPGEPGVGGQPCQGRLEAGEVRCEGHN
jgi:hypothetical protein